MGLYRVTLQRVIYVAAPNDEEAEDLAQDVSEDEVPANARSNRVHAIDRVDRAWVNERPFIVTENGNIERMAATCAEMLREREGE